MNNFSVQRNVGLEFRLEESYARQVPTRGIAMNRADLRLPGIARATGRAAVNGSRDLGQRSVLNLIF